MKKFVLCLIFVIIISLSCVYASNFSDLSQEHWAYEAVNKMVELNIVNGYPDGTFKPQGKITRAEFAKILVLSLELKEKSNVEFIDVKSDYWGYDYIKIASNYLTGYNNNGKLLFLPNMQAVREDMAVAIVIAQNLQNTNYDLATLDKFTDKNEISKDLQKYIAIAVENGLMKGNADGTFNPQGELTRAEASQLILNTLEVKGKIAINDAEKGEYKKIDNSKDIVYEVLQKWPANVVYEYIQSLPVINLDYSDIKILNEKIADKAIDWPYVGYEYYIYDSILSLKIIYGGFSGTSGEIVTYNIDRYTGTIMNNEDLLDKLNIDSEMYLSKARLAIMDAFEESWQDVKNEFNEDYINFKSFMQDSKNNNIDNYIYIERDGDLYIISKLCCFPNEMDTEEEIKVCNVSDF